jgi:hypothetical protein
LILNAGGGYHVLLAEMEWISVDLGQLVLTGEPAAVMGGGSQVSTAVATGTKQPVLYVEFRKDGTPIDPSPLWALIQQTRKGFHMVTKAGAPLRVQEESLPKSDKESSIVGELIGLARGSGSESVVALGAIVAIARYDRTEWSILLFGLAVLWSIFLFKLIRRHHFSSRRLGTQISRVRSQRRLGDQSK